MSERKIIPFPTRCFVLELHSERFLDLVQALHSQGFQITNTGHHTNRFRIEDADQAKEQSK
jgi:hypothetical protein